MLAISRQVLKRPGLLSAGRQMSSMAAGTMQINEFVAEMAQEGVTRGAVVYDMEQEQLIATHECLKPLADFVAESPDFLCHEGFFFEIGEKTGALLAASLWWTFRGQGCGGIRMRPYETIGELVTDNMRLATGMGRKSALAGLWWGGGKGVLAAPRDRDVVLNEQWRQDVFEDYGRFVTGLRGCYVCAEDAGLHVQDLDRVHQFSRFATCISPDIGGSGNPSIPTAAGVVKAMEGALEYKGWGDLSNKRVVVQGLGNVGRPLVRMLLDNGVASVTGVDIEASHVELAKREAAGDNRFVAMQDDGDSLLDIEADIFAPCAYGGVLNSVTIPRLRAGIVCGAANNQLHEAADADRLLERGICYVPDFVANRMGIVNCANEQYGTAAAESIQDPAIARHLSDDWDLGVKQTVMRVLRVAEQRGESPDRAAVELADEMATQEHPIWGHRPRAIVQGLLRDGWWRGRDQAAAAEAPVEEDEDDGQGELHRAGSSMPIGDRPGRGTFARRKERADNRRLSGANAGYGR